MTAVPPHRLSVAPMIQYTDLHWRYLVRGITKHTLLYTEMTMSNTLIHNPSILHTFIGHSTDEHPLSLQLGGNTAESLGEASYLACSYSPDWHSINLNCGCPSNKALTQGFGAELMLDTENTRQCVQAMVRKSSVPVTVKCRLGAIPGLDTHEQLVHFIANVKSAGCSHIIMHARECMLKGLSPAQNRTVPPLRYDDVALLRAEFPDIDFTLNGGVTTLEQAAEFLTDVATAPPPPYKECGTSTSTSTSNSLQGVMIGRAVYNNPWMLADADSLFFNTPDMHNTRRHALERYLSYCDDLENDSARYYNTTACIKPLHNFFAGAGNFQTMYKRKLDAVLKGKTIGPPSNRDSRKAGRGGGSAVQGDSHGSTKYVTSSYVGENHDDSDAGPNAGTIRKIVEAALVDTIPASFLDEDPTTVRHLTDREIRASHGEQMPVARSAGGGGEYDKKRETSATAVAGTDVGSAVHSVFKLSESDDCCECGK